MFVTMSLNHRSAVLALTLGILCTPAAAQPAFTTLIGNYTWTEDLAQFEDWQAATSASGATSSWSYSGWSGQYWGPRVRGGVGDSDSLDFSGSHGVGSSHSIVSPTYSNPPLDVVFHIGKIGTPTFTMAFELSTDNGSTWIPIQTITESDVKGETSGSSTRIRANLGAVYSQATFRWSIDSTGYSMSSGQRVRFDGFGWPLSNFAEQTEFHPYDVLQVFFWGNPTGITNPFWDVEVSVDFECDGDGEVITRAGFYYLEHTWCVRFAPTKSGTWEYTAKATVGGQTVVVDAGSFDCDSSADNPGYVEVSTQYPKNFEFSSGEPFVPLGANVALPWQRHQLDIDAASITDFLVDNNINLLRVLAFCARHSNANYEPHTSLNLLSESGALDRYNLQSALQFERDILSPCIDNEVYISFCCAVLYGSTATFAPWSSHDWSTSLGGPYANPQGYYNLSPSGSYSGPNHQDLQEKYYRYIVRRWGAYTNIAFWEYHNEVGNLWSSPATWLNVIEPVMDAEDAYSRPKFVSHWAMSHSASLANYNSTRNDIADICVYPNASYLGSNGTELAIDEGVRQRVSTTYQAIGKPVMVREYAELDPNGNYQSRHLWTRLITWSSFMSGAHSMFWTDSGWSDIPYRREVFETTLRHFGAFVQSIGFRNALIPDASIATTSATSDIRVHAMSSTLTGSAEEYVGYLHHYTSHSTVMSGKTLSLTLPTSNDYVLEWYQPEDGEWVGYAAIVGPTPTVTIPDFAVDLAFRVSVP